MRKLLPSLLIAFASLAVTAPAQTPCASLTVSGSGQPGTTLTFDLNAAADAYAFLVIGETTGSSSISFGNFGTLDLGLVPPYIALPMGKTDGNGDVSLSIDLPSSGLQPRNLHAQGGSVEFSFTPPGGGSGPSFGLTFCTSNVASFQIQ